MSIFWDNVKAVLKNQNTKQEWLAEQLGINQRTLEGWIFHNRVPDADTAFKISQILNTSLEYLVTGKEPEQTNKYKTAIEEIQAAINKIK